MSDLSKNPLRGSKKVHIIDTHCDVLWKLQEKKRRNEALDFAHDPDLQANLTRLKIGRVKLQFFAIFVHDNLPSDEKWQAALEQIDIFYEEIIGKHEEVKHIRQWTDLFHLKEGEIAAVLSVEGLDMIGNDVMKLRQLLRLGVLAVGLTWNKANLCADGVGEERGAGLTAFGQEVIDILNQHKIMLDLSHSSDAAFDEILSLADYPFVSHSNSRTVYNHARNLRDDQAEALFAREGLLHLNFYPPFICGEEEGELLSYWCQHLAHFISLGGENFLGIGADFDGIDMVGSDIAHAGMYGNVSAALLKEFSKEKAEKFTSENFLHYIKRNFVDEKNSSIS